MASCGRQHSRSEEESDDGKLLDTWTSARAMVGQGRTEKSEKIDDDLS